MIEIKNLTKNFQKFTALNDVSLEFNDGHSIALIGPNGCGKTTPLPPIALRRHLDGIKGAPIGSAATRLGMLVGLGAACGVVGVIVFQLLHMIDGLIVGR